MNTGFLTFQGWQPLGYSLSFEGNSGMNMLGFADPDAAEPNGTTPATDVRSFAPSQGISEYPVGDSGNGGVAAFVRERALPGLYPEGYVDQQGMSIGRDGRIRIGYNETSIHVAGQAERLVYLYGCCDRKLYHPLIGTPPAMQLPNRWLGTMEALTSQDLKDLCEPTAANEMEIAATSEAFRQQHGAGLSELFGRMGPHLCDAAHSLAKRVPSKT